VTRKINVADIRRAAQYAWNDATGEFRVYNSDRAHFGFWIRSEVDGEPTFTHLTFPALGPRSEDELHVWNHTDGCGCGFCEAT
jgi:hypothetical protein